ncbi:eIF2A-related protein [Dapis sp. BLCC M126]|uniref:nSTAND1 domain-containing NTPase n=1 Tax=Dapis sp. BLCC M126 TaxID=3400189 RepID=UPI003CE6DFA7
MNREALVVGINSYPFLKKKKPGDLNLKAPVKDAEAIAEMLEKYGKFHVQRLPKTYNEEGQARFVPNGLVKVNDLEKRIINLFNPPSKNEVPDVALLFFAGHGYLKEKGGIQEGFLATSDAQIKNEKYGISLNWLKQLLKNSPVKTQIVWLDCCFSGEFLNFQEADPGTGKQVSRCFITAARSFETSVEQIDGEQGVFTARLLKGLNPENSVDGWVTNYILADSIKKNMLNTAQAPVFHNSGNAIILTTNSPTQPVDERWQNTPPYRALSYFTEREEDAVFFHGRTRLTDELINQVRTNNFVAILGASGSGKSSLLRAGLLYQLKRGQKTSGSDRWQYLDPFTPTSTPLENLQQAINIEEEKPENLSEKLIDFIQSAEAERVIMVIDQFEESFTLCETHKKRQKFFDCFLAAIGNKAIQNNFCLILGMRADFLDQCSKYPGLATQIKDNQFLVTPLEKEEIEEAIKKPAELVAMGVEPGLVAQMTEDFLRNPGSLPLLQYTLDVLWKDATQGEEKSKYLTLATYRKFGGIQGTLTKRANEVFESLSQEEKSVAKRIFLELVQPGEKQINSGKITDTRRRVILENLPNEQHSLGMLLKVSDKLADQNNRLITIDKSEIGTLLDIIHEDLIRSWKTLREWVEEYQEVLPLVRKIEGDATEWKKHNKKDDWLWREGQLMKAEEYLANYGDMGLLDGFAYDFVKASQELRTRWEVEGKERKKRELKQEKKARKLAQRRNQILAISLLFMTGVSAFAVIQQRIAKHNSEASFARQIAAEAEVAIANWNWYDRGTLLGLQSMVTVQELHKNRYAWWRKAVNKLLGDQPLYIPQNAADGAIRKGLSQLPDHLHTFKHESGVNAIALSKDGKTIATATDDKSTQLWDTTTGKEIATLNYQDKVIAVALSKNGKTITTRSEDKVARLWDAATGNAIGTLLHHSGVNAVAYSPNGKIIATASDDNTVRLWDTATGNAISTLVHYFPVNALAFSPDGTAIATASDDNITRFWDTATGKEFATLDYKARVHTLVFSPDGKRIATASDDNTVRLWDTRTCKEITTLKHQDKIIALAFSPNSKTIATASDNNTARLWDICTGQEVAILLHQYKVKAVTFSPDGKTIATASDNNTARLWDTHTGKQVASFNHQDKVNALAFSPEGKTIVTASDDKTARLWDTNVTQEVTTLKHQSSVRAVAFSPDGKTIATASYDKTARLWDANTGKQVATLNYQSKVNAVAFSPDGKTIATASADNTANLRDAATGQAIATLNHQGEVVAVAFSPEGKTIATASDDKTARLWDAATGQAIATLNHQGEVIAVAFSRNGKTIATASADNTARLWNANTGKQLATLNHQDEVRAVAFSRNGKTIATASADNTARLWNANTGKQLATLNHQDEVRAVAFSRNGKTIATASADKTARLWNADTGKQLTILLHQGTVRAVAFSRNGKTIATASADNTARLWDTKTGKQVATFNHQGEVRAVAFNQNGNIIATASNDNTARIHWVMPKDLVAEACRRLGRNLTAEEWQQYINSSLDTYQRTCDELPVHYTLIAEAKNLAKTGEKENIKTAISIFKHAQKLQPEIDLNPDTETIETEPELVANKFAASGELEKGKKLAKQGNIEGAISLYNRVQKSYSDVEIDSNDWGELCRSGSLNNQAQDVMFACEKAVELSPDNPRIMGIRGLAKALNGDYQGAIDDFQVLLDWIKDEEQKARVKGWIETLKKGENLFTSEVLEELSS